MAFSREQITSTSSWNTSRKASSSPKSKLKRDYPSKRQRNISSMSSQPSNIFINLTSSFEASNPKALELFM